MKKKLLLVVAMVIALASLLAISAFADSVHANVDKTETVTLTNGTVLPLFDADGDALIWYIDASAESGYSSIKAQANTAGGPYVQYKRSWNGTTHNNKAAYQVSTISVTDANGKTFANTEIVVFNIMDDDVLINENGQIGKPVNCLSDTFKSCTNLQYAYLRLDTVNLFDNAFNGCSNLKYVNLENITELVGINGANVFNGCTNLFANQTMDLSRTPLVQVGVDASSKGGTFCKVGFKTVILPETVKVIGHYAFQECPNLETFYFPSSLERFAGYATFKSCPLLTTLVGLENTSVTSIPSSAFYKCTSLKEFALREGITVIGSSAFFQCTSLTSLTLPSTLTTIQGVSGNNDDGTFEGCTSIKSVTIPKSVTSIYGNTFYGCSGLETLTFEDRMLPDGTYNPLTFYGWAPFEKCTSLTKVVLPEGLTNLHNGMFNACSKLASVTFPSTLNSISGGSQFAYTALSEVIGLENTSITTITHSMFRGCKQWTGDANGVVRLPNTVETIDKYGLADVKMTTLVLGASFKSLYTGGEHSFAGTTNLKYVYAPASTTVLSQGNANFQLIFVTSTNEDVLATISATTGISNVITYAQYQKGEYTSGTKYIVSGYNLCDAFYDGHVETEEQISKWTGDKFLSNYKIVCPCGRNCGAETVIKELAPLFVSKGYSASDKAMMQAFVINKALWVSEYQTLFPELKYGMVAAYNGTNGEGFDTTSGKIVNADGTGINTKVAVVDMTEREYDVFEIKISGLDAKNEAGEYAFRATSFFLCAYVILDGQVYYIDNGATAESAMGACYNDVADFTDYDYIPVSKEEDENV